MEIFNSYVTILCTSIEFEMSIMDKINGANSEIQLRNMQVCGVFRLVIVLDGFSGKLKAPLDRLIQVNKAAY